MTALPAADTGKKFTYHHGNLREALLTAALHILSAGSVADLNLRALAKATGVTQAAPYTHFRDKDELLAAIAEKGFQQLALSMAEGATGAFSVRERIEKLMSCYIRFALSNKPLFSLMFGRELADLKKFPTLAMTAGKSYALISAALSKRQTQEPDTRFLTVAIWSLSHGLTTLLLDGKVDPAQFGAASIEGFVKKNVDVFANSLI